MTLSAFRLSTLVAFFIAASSATEAGELRLDCTMTDYSGLSGIKVETVERAALDVRSLIPEHAVHVVDGESTWIEGTDLFGTYSRDGRQRRLKYEARLPVLGKAEITYTYIISSGQITARVLFPQRQLNRHIDRIAGTCKRLG